jgi:thiamine biosynthesis protein ThiS
VEINGKILPKADYGEYVFADGDNCEIVNFVGGG